MNNENNIPINWINLRLGDICLTSSGGTPSRNIKSYYAGNIPWIKSGELKYNTIFTSEEKISQDAIDNSSTKLIPKGSLLIALYGATVGRLAFLGIDAATNQAVASIMCFAGMPNKYLFYYLLNRKEELLEKRIGGAQPNISQTILNDLVINIPPLNEQHRIVSKIEELFSDLDNGIANLKRAQNQLKVYRQALLKSAFEGKLTEQWRKENNPEPAEKLLERIKEERKKRYEQELKDWKEAVKVWEKEGKKVEKPTKPVKFSEISSLENNEIAILDKLPKLWEWTKIGSVIKNLDQGWSPQCENFNAKSDEWGVIKTTAIQSNFFDETSNKKLPSNLSPRFQYELSKGDILITRAGPRNRVGVCCLVKNVRPKLINCDKVYRIKSLIVIPDFIVYMLNSLRYSKELEKTKTGISDSGVNLKQDIFLKMPIPLCSVEEQIKIVEIIDDYFTVCDKLDQEIEFGIKKSESLRQSILKKAFEGKLVAQDANDEPASELLKRIQAEKKKYLEEQKVILKKSRKVVRNN